MGRRKRRSRKRKHIANEGGQRLAAELRGQDLTRILILPIDAGKRSHKALIANALGDIVIQPFEFDNNLSGALLFDKQVRKAIKEERAVYVLAGIESTGHYAENFVSELLRRNYEVRQVNSLAVTREREAGLTWCKTDEIDLCAIGQLLLNGKGQPAKQLQDLYYNLKQAVRARRSSVRRRATLELQIHCYMDRLYPGLLNSDIFSDAFGSTAMAFINHYGSAQRARRVGEARLSNWLAKRHFPNAKQKAAELSNLARQCLSLSSDAEEALLQAVRFRVEEHMCLSNQIRVWEKRMAEYLVETPGIWLLALYEVNVISAAEYMGELGPLSLYEGAEKIIGRAGLVPKKWQSAESLNQEGGITKLGHKKLRYIIGLIGKNLIRKNEYFVAFYRRLVEGKVKEERLATTAVACKFVRISWAMMTLMGNFVPPSEDLNRDIENKYKEFLQKLGATELYRMKLEPRLKKKLEKGKYRKDKPIRPIHELEAEITKPSPLSQNKDEGVAMPLSLPPSGEDKNTIIPLNSTC